jgi:hypothetical protein
MKEKMWQSNRATSSAIDEPLSAYPNIPAALEGGSLINRGQHPRSDVVEENRVAEVCLLHCLYVYSDTSNISFDLQEAVTPKPRFFSDIFSCIVPRFASVGSAVQFLFTLYNDLVLVFAQTFSGIQNKRASLKADLHTQIKDSISLFTQQMLRQLTLEFTQPADGNRIQTL